MAALADVDSSALPPSESSKGKGKMDDEAEAEGAEKMCGICYVDGRRAIRGELDCCAHFFCFVCIMAWGRVESRCPFCKARFRTIRRPPVAGRFPDERIVSVPERNQVCSLVPLNQSSCP
jgi:PHD and RING finger domain-containing protein 1